VAPGIEEALRDADRHSRPVRLAFRDGGRVTARIRDIDWDVHQALTYMDLDGACGTRVAPLEDIVEAVPA
jgi:hypothetical protein